MQRGVFKKVFVYAASSAALALAIAGPAFSLPEKAPTAPKAPLTVETEPRWRVLTEAQYSATIGNIFGDDIQRAVRFAPLRRDEGLLANGARLAIMTPGALDLVESTARKVAAQVVDEGHRDFLVGCRPPSEAARDDACARAFISRVGRLLYRRPLTGAELRKAVVLAGTSVGKGASFYDGLAYVLSGFLTSPEFLYITERTERDPAGGTRLDAYSKASRLSFFLWNAAPDDLLLKAAERGELSSPAGVTKQVKRMLASPAAASGVRAFFADMLALDDLKDVAKDTSIYPAYTLAVAGYAREQALRTIVDHVVTRNLDYRDLMTTRRTFLTQDLGAIYRVPVEAKPGEWVPYEFPANSSRAGLLTHVAFLSQFAHPGRSSPTRRGRGIRETLLCQEVPNPPPDVDFSSFEDPAGDFASARDRLKAHNENPVCAGCHKLTDPMGLALENFDGAGQFRVAEKGVRIDPSSVLDGTPVADAVGVGKVLRESPEIAECLVQRLASYGVGRPMGGFDNPWITQLNAEFVKDGYRVMELMRVLATSGHFFSLMPSQPRDAAKQQIARASARKE